LKEKLLKEIYLLKDESSKVELIVELVSKVTNRWNKDHKGHKDCNVGKEIIDNVLSVSSNYIKIKGLIEIYNYLDKLEEANIEPIIIDLILAMEGKEAKFSLMDEFIAFPYVKFLSRDLADRIKGNFDLLEQVCLMGKHFSVWLGVLHDDYPQHYNLYKTEKTRIIDEAKTITSKTYKYSVLLGLLEEFPLEKKEIAKISTLAFSVIKQAANNSNNILLKEKIKLLGFLPKGKKKQLALMLLEEISQTGQGLMDELENIINYLGYCCWRKAGKEKIFEIRDEAIKEVSDLIGFLHKYDKRDDQDNFEVISFLTSKRFFEMVPYIWTDLILDLIERINSPITKVDSLILLLCVKRSSSFKNKLIKQILGVLSLIEDEAERLILTVKLFKRLKRKNRQIVITKLLSEIAMLCNEPLKAELLVEMLPYLTYKQAKEAFEVVEEIESGFNRVWASVAYVKYLAKGKGGQIIHNAVEVLEACASAMEKICLIRQLIRFGLDNQSNSDI
ncbi:MAG: hypothetical protein WAQ98_19540, partial [Blastocatellia bacterium]